MTIEPSMLYVGTPVLLLGSLNDDGSANLAASSSYWALGKLLVLGLEDDGHTLANIQARPELTVSFPSPALWTHIEQIANTTGADPVPETKAAKYRTHRDKFALAGLTAQPSEVITPPRVAECELQFETVVRRATQGLGDYHMVEAEVVRVHAAPRIVIEGTHHLDPDAWEPTLYVFRHYFGLGKQWGARPNADAVLHRHGRRQNA